MAGYCDNFSMIDGDSSNFSMIDGGDEFKAFPGLKGDDGTTFYPHVSAEGILSWTNDGGKPNPDPVNIKGTDGTSAYQAAVEAGFSGTEAEFNTYLSGIGDLTDLVDRKAGALIDTVSGAIASFVPDSTIDNLLGVSVAVEPVQAGSGDPSPDNVRPISGWSAVGIEAAGVNLLELDNASNPNRESFTYTTETAEKVSATKTASGGSFFAQYKLSVKAGETYTFALDSYSVGGVAQQTANIYLYSDRLWGTSVKGNWNVSTGGAQWTATYTGTVVVGVFTTVAANTAIEISGFQCAHGTTKPAFKPYAGNTYTITLGQTVYGGTLDVTNGTMTITQVKAQHSFALPTRQEKGRWVLGFYPKNILSTLLGKQVAVSEPPLKNLFRASNLPIIKEDNLTSADSASVSFYGHNAGVEIRPRFLASQFSAEEAQTIASAMEFVYPINPITITLDPVTIAAIAGQTNNVWSDAGDVDVTYAADIKAYIDRLNQPTEDDMIANTLIQSGKYFTVNNRLFLSTASIAAGAQIIPGTNCTETSLAAALNALNA